MMNYYDRKDHDNSVFHQYNLSRLQQGVKEESGRMQAIEATLADILYKDKKYPLLMVISMHDWGLRSFDSLSTTTWLILRDGMYFTINGYGGEKFPDDFTLTCGELSYIRMKKIMSLLNKEWGNTHTDGCDGTAYQFEAFTSTGERRKATELGYIYGNSVLEKLVEQISSNKRTFKIEFSKWSYM